MEVDKNKKNKRNKKKRSKQAAKQIESATHDTRESASNSQSNVLERGEDNNYHQIAQATDDQDDVGEHLDADKEGALPFCFEGRNLAEMGENFRLDRETSFLEQVKELQSEKDALAEKEASQNVKIQQLQNEKYGSMMNETILKEKLMQLEKENNALIEKVVRFEEKIKSMKEETAALSLQEGNLQEKIRQMERERDSWIQNENTAKESIANLIDEKAQLKAQVIELEQTRRIVTEEKQQLQEVISKLRSQITNLDSSACISNSSMNYKVGSEEEMKYTIEAALTLIEKLVAEKSELVEKVNELHAKHDQGEVRRMEHFSSVGSLHGAIPGDGSTFTPALVVGDCDGNRTAPVTSSESKASEVVQILGSNQSLEDGIVEDKRNGEHMNLSDGYGVGVTTSEMEGDEIVQIPLHENEDVEETNMLLGENDESADVPLMDAPLIGAPFRLITFVARYVSGADLVNKDAGRLG
ncbi:uncharacterized protein LOC127252028 [Andrographis paniculata]|uniref:uncharacterized protein LOC127252028 n=1 Tax=Andrographis paniculata TaxID=175694 RepID=UPI0021E87645|nr:uncharacterized protein LOC127252028 [Andrographis paniculata]XP_051131981.1 uncharacterized protein LOC127252028 [Andrographis paniculata]